jgi:photosystem II stability/assembly factor-like uncharacterized protein
MKKFLFILILISVFQASAQPVGYIVGNSGALFKTTNGGTTWSKIAGGGVFGSIDLNGVHFVNNTTGYIVGNSGALFKTTNGGTTWSKIAGGGVFGLIDLNGIQFVDDATGYIVGNSGALFKTTNGGETWSNIAGGGVFGSIDLNGISINGGATGYIVGNNGNVFKSNNNGTNWLKVVRTSGPGSLTNLKGVYFLNGTNGYIVTNDGGVLETTNAGRDWRGRYLDSMNLNGIHFCCGPAYIVGNNGALFKSTNNGSTWSNIAGGGVFGSINLNGIHFIFTTTSVNEISQLDLFSFYPNPAESVINVNDDIKLIGKPYFIYDNTGKLVITKTINEKGTIDLSELNKGVYVIKIGDVVQRIVKM